MAKLTGFTPIQGAPFGTGVFETEDGQAFQAHSPDDAAQFMPPPQPDMRLASTNPADVYATPEWQAQQTAHPPVPQQQADIVPQMGPPETELTRQQSDKTAPQAQAAHQQPNNLEAEFAARSQPDINAMMRGNTSEKPAKRETLDSRFGGGAVPKGMTVNQQNLKYSDAGIAYTPEEREARAEASINESMARQQTAQSQIEIERARGALASEQADRSVREVQQAQAAKRRIQESYDLRRTAVEAEIDDAATQKIDRNGIFKDSGTLGVLGAALAQGFGAYAASVLHTPNYAQQMIDSAVERDIAAQRDQVQRKGAAANNKLARLMNDHHIGIDEATQRLTQGQQRLADLQTLELAHATKQEDIKNNYNEWYAGRQKARLDEDRHFSEIAAGKQSGEVVLKKAAVAGAGSNIPPILKAVYGNNPQEIEKAFARYQAEGGKGGVEGFLDQTKKIGTKMYDGGGGGGGGVDVKLRGAQQGQLVKEKESEAAGRIQAERYGLELNPETGEYEVPSNLGGAYEFLTNKLGRIAQTQGSHQRFNTSETMADTWAGSTTQGVPDTETKHRYRTITDTDNPWKMAAAINEARRAGRVASKATYAVAGKSVVKSDVKGQSKDDNEEDREEE
jgi:hypothetical protein